MIRRELTSLFVFVLSAATPALADDAAKPAEPMTVQPSGTPGTVVARESEQVAAIVTAIDLGKRQVTLQGPKGRVENMHVDEKVQNLDQVKVGDFVSIRFQRGMVLTLQSPGQADVAPHGEVAAARAAPGEKPAAGVAAVIRGTVTVKEIDMKHRLVTLVGVDGREFRVKAGPDVRLDKVKVGDKVYGEYGEALAVSVEARKKPKAAK